MSAKYNNKFNTFTKNLASFEKNNKMTVHLHYYLRIIYLNYPKSFTSKLIDRKVGTNLYSVRPLEGVRKFDEKLDYQICNRFSCLYTIRRTPTKLNLKVGRRILLEKLLEENKLIFSISFPRNLLQ